MYEIQEIIPMSIHQVVLRTELLMLSALSLYTKSLQQQDQVLSDWSDLSIN
jgi:hypothetical protein